LLPLGKYLSPLEILCYHWENICHHWDSGDIFGTVHN
jgi:hypothetical protein